MTKSLLSKTIASAIHGRNVSSMDNFGANCKTAKDWKKLEMRCYRKGWMYKLFVTGELPNAGCDPFFLYAAYTVKESVKSAFFYAAFKRSCMSSDAPDYVFPFKLYSYDRASDQSRFVYHYEPKEPMPNWGTYKLVIPGDPYKRYWYLYYSKNEQTAIEEAHEHARFCLLNDNGSHQMPIDYVPKPYYVLHNDKIIYTHKLPYEVNPDYLLVDRFSR
jgi:hypothetical protein